MAIFKKKKDKKDKNSIELDDVNDNSLNNEISEPEHDFQVGELGEREQKQVDETEIAPDADEMPLANSSGREGGSKKKLQVAIIGLVGLLIVLVGVGIAVARYEDSKEAKRIEEAELTAQEQKKMATGSVDISEDQARIEMSQFDDLPPPAGLEEPLPVDTMATQPQPYEPITPVDNSPAYNPPPPSPSTYEPVQAYNPPPVDSTPPSTNSSFFGGTSPSPSFSQPLNDEMVEFTPPPVKGANSNVLVDVNALRTAEASASASNENSNSNNGVGGNLNKTNLLNASANRRGSRTLTLLRGTTIPCVLQTKIDSTYKGFTVCQTSRDVYSSDGRTLLIDRGSKVFGEQNVEIKQGQARVAVLWTRVETPNGVSVDIDSPATGSLGEMGVGANVNNHFWKRFGGAIMLSIIQDAISAGSSRLEDRTKETGNNNTTVQNTERTTESMAEKALENTINIPPTATVNQGTLVNIMVVRDVDFSNVYKLQRR